MAGRSRWWLPSKSTSTLATSPVFMAVDACKALGYSNPTDAVRRLVNPNDKARISLGLPGQPPIFLTESGLYALILGSKLPTAHKFKHWVTSWVLPAIRKAGMYVMGEEKIQADAADSKSTAMLWRPLVDFLAACLLLARGFFVRVRSVEAFTEYVPAPDGLSFFEVRREPGSRFVWIGPVHVIVSRRSRWTA